VSLGLRSESHPAVLDVARGKLTPRAGRPKRPKRVVIVGAGMAGLVAASELLLNRD
jgi:NADPH-dependent 2,4-dienoyl-CoA reductase/sulfur reductase-like enzyme